MFCFLKYIVCKDDEIPAFSAMMKMGLNCLYLTNWLHEKNYFLLPLVRNSGYTSFHIKNFPGRISELEKTHIGPFCLVLVYFSRIE